MHSTRHSRARSAFRRLRETPTLRPFFQAMHFDETELRQLALQALEGQAEKMQALMQAHTQYEAERILSTEFHASMLEICNARQERSDRELVQLARAAGSVHWLYVAGVLPSLPEEANQPDKLAVALNVAAAVLTGNRGMRVHNLKARVVLAAVGAQYDAQRAPPAAYALAGTEHVLTAEHVARLRAGEALVLDPALLPPEQLASAHADLAALAAAGGVQPSRNPCNAGALHGMLPLSGDGLPLRVPARALLRALAALPALVAAHGWPRGLAVPPVAQLGLYPADGRTSYVPHRDRQPHEAQNKRELTFLLYVNAGGWDGATDGGCLRLHAEGLDEAGGASGPRYVDVEPKAGRIVVFQSGLQVHEVLPSRTRDRLALTLWVEYV